MISISSRQLRRSIYLLLLAVIAVNYSAHFTQLGWNIVGNVPPLLEPCMLHENDVDPTAGTQTQISM